MYAKSVLMPESTQGGRIPSRFAIPTATLQHFEKFDVSTNDLGQAIVSMYPNDTSKLAMLDNQNGIDFTTFASYKGGVSKASINNGVMARSRVVSAVMKFHFTQNALNKQGSRTIALVPSKKIYANA